jgi:hypothetical protein
MKAHLEILEKKKKVWWGWWKKDKEPLRLDMLERRLPKGTAGTFQLIDSVSRMWSIACSEWTANRNEIDINLLPHYYRGSVEKVAAFFLVTGFSPEPFDKELSELLVAAERTIIDLGDPEDIQNAKAAANGHLLAPIDSKTKSCVLHLSDLHFGKDYGFRSSNEKAKVGDRRVTLTECLVQDLSRIGVRDDIGAIVVTGDFVSGADWNDQVRGDILDEFGRLRSALQIGHDAIITTPGNHDMVRYRVGQGTGVADQSVDSQIDQRHERDFRTFIDRLVGRDWQKPLNFVCCINLKSADLLICALNSCTITATEWTEYGYVGASGLSTIKLLGSQPSLRPTYKCLALHHHLLPVAGIEVPQANGVSLTLDASQLLEAAQKAGVHLALHGHQHIPKVARYQNIPLRNGSCLPPIHIVSNGSTGAKLERLGNERNTYCVFKFSEDRVTLYIRELRHDGQEAGTLFEGKLEISPELP